jgi:hypothetical protein
VLVSDGSVLCKILVYGVSNAGILDHEILGIVLINYCQSRLVLLSSGY